MMQPIVQDASVMGQELHVDAAAALDQTSKKKNVGMHDDGQLHRVQDAPTDQTVDVGNWMVERSTDCADESAGRIRAC
jgi:hypothetical protein